MCSSESSSFQLHALTIKHGFNLLYIMEQPAPRFGPCTVEELKPRMVRAVASLGPSDVKDILAEQGEEQRSTQFELYSIPLPRIPYLCKSFDQQMSLITAPVLFLLVLKL